MHVPELFGLWAGHGRMAKAPFKKQEKPGAWRNVDVPSMPRMTVSNLRRVGIFLSGLGHVVKYGVCHHQKQLVDLGKNTMVMKQAGSDRAAFAIEVHEAYTVQDEAVITEWSHARMTVSNLRCVGIFYLV